MYLRLFETHIKKHIKMWLIGLYEKNKKTWSSFDKNFKPRDNTNSNS